MTNPFAAATATAPAEEKAAAPVDTTKTEAPANLGIGDPFADPAGVGDGSRITEFVGRLLLVKPTEVIEEMNTSQGKARDVVRADIAVLDDAEEPGRIVEGVLLFQQALKREAKKIYDGPLPYLIGRLDKGKTGGGNTLYTFQAASEEEKNIARQFLEVKSL
ncbi:hypothetical protein NTR1_71 [Nocardia phage NTR1]|nr:hypothetical protein NTR1_71 [Nocardia phage NTR1]